MASTSHRSDRPPLKDGTHVEVRTAFGWAGGFAVAGHGDDGYLIRRRSDDEILPAVFDGADVRRDHRHSTWWV